jgi:hypothetical protein
MTRLSKTWEHGGKPASAWAEKALTPPCGSRTKFQGMPYERTKQMQS